MERSLKSQVISDLNKKMVFLAGPRQVGKTTLAKSLYTSSDYLNWDIDEDRTRILRKDFSKKKLWIFDEIHKFPKWRNYLKGLFDKWGNDQKILVTGSAKLDTLRKGGDSLQGRYHFLRLMPLSYTELSMNNAKDLFDLYSLSGFPEPFFGADKKECNRWSRSYRERIIRQEVASQELFHDLGTMEIMLQRLPEIAGKTLSINSLQEDLQVAHKTIEKWVQSLERLYTIFRIAPYGPPKIKAIKKEQKLYFYDWNAAIDSGPRFENLVAVHLLKWVFLLQDTEGRGMDLRYYRDKYDREVDFIILENNRPVLMIEVKTADTEIGKGIKYLKSIFSDCRAIQIHLKGNKDYIDSLGIECMPAYKFLAELP